jgi:hypothetical protein
MDGGHHLPTLGLSPDIIIVPAAAGYAVHAATLDGIRVEQITAIVRQNRTKVVVAVVPRWALVKNQRSLDLLTRRIMAASFYRDSQEAFAPECRPGISQHNGVISAYVNRAYANDVNIMYRLCQQIGLDQTRFIYLAFDYSLLSEVEAQKYTEDLQGLCHKKVIRSNEPVKVSTVFLRGKQ